MAQYADLKAAINAVIKQNNNQEITGSILNNVLNAMVNSLGANYQLAGVAIPSTNPGTPDQNVYWLAYQGGTYTNFGGAQLPAGISMLKWNGAWSAQTFFTVDDEPTANSNNLVKSGGVSKFIMPNHFIGNGSTYTRTLIKLIKGRTYRVVLDNPSYARNDTGSGSAQYIFEVAYYNGNSWTTIRNVTRTNDTGTLNKYYDFVVPQNSEYIGIGGRANTGVEVLFDIYDITEIYQLRDADALIDSKISPQYSQQGYRGKNTYTTFSPSANIIADENYALSTLIPVVSSESYTIICPLVQNDNVALISYDENKQPIGYRAETNRTVTFSSEEKYIALSVRYADADQFAVRDANGIYLYKGSKEKSLYEEIRQVKSEAALLEAYIANTDDEPITGSNNLVKSGGVSKFVTLNHFIGAGSTYTRTLIKLIKGRTYRVVLDNPSYARNDTGSGSTQYIFEVVSYNGSTGTSLANVMRRNDTGTLNKYYDFVVPQDSEYIGVGGRANEGVEVLFSVYDITEIYQLRGADALINNKISPQYSQQGYRGVNTYSSAVRIVADENYALSALIPVVSSESYAIVAPLQGGDNVALITYDDNKQPLGFRGEWNRTVTFSSEEKYVALSVRYADADQFALKDSNGEYLYLGNKEESLYDDIRQVESKVISLEAYIENTDSEPTAISNKLMKSKDIYKIISTQNYTPNERINSSNNIVFDNDWCLSEFIELGDFTNITVHFGEIAGTDSVIVFYNANGQYMDYKQSNAADRTIAKTAIGSYSNLKYCRFSYRKGYASAGIELDGEYIWVPTEEGYVEKYVKSVCNLGADIYLKNEDKLDVLRASSNNARRLQLLIATDTHEDFVALQNAVDFANQCEYIDALLLLGDNCGQATASLSVFQQYNTIVNSCTKPVLSLPGNHDAGYDYRLRYTVTNDKILQYITEPTLQYLAEGEHVSGKTYFFHDFTAKKIRVICLNDYDEDINLASNQYWETVPYDSSYDTYALSHEYAIGDLVSFALYTDYSFRCVTAHTSSADNELKTTEYRGYRFIGETQANWLVSTMLSTPADYGIVICCHVPASNNFCTMYRDNKFCSKFLSGNTGYNAMSSDVLGILADAFNKGLSSSILVKGTGDFSYMNDNTIDGEQCAYKLEYDFSGKNTGAKFMVFLCGHTHIDMIFKNSLGLYAISPTFTTATTRQFDTNDCPRSSDDKSIARDALTVVAFDYVHDGVILTRVGTTSTTDGYLRDVDRLDLTQ